MLVVMSSSSYGRGPFWINIFKMAPKRIEGWIMNSRWPLLVNRFKMAPKRIEGWIINSKWPLTNCKIETYVCVIEKEP